MAGGSFIYRKSERPLLESGLKLHPKYIRNAILDILRATLEYQVPNCMFLSQFSHNCLYAKWRKISIRGKICVTNNPVGIPHRTRRALLRAVSFEYPLFIVVIRKRSTTAADHYLSLKTLLLKMQRIHPRPSLRLWTGSSAQMIEYSLKFSFSHLRVFL